MTAYWPVQGVDIIVFLIGTITFINRDERRFRLQLAVYSAIIGVHFFLMGAGSVGMSTGLNALRMVISLRIRSLWVVTVSILLTLILGLGKLQHTMELLPIIDTVANTWALPRYKGLTIRCVIWYSTACWVTHNLWLGSIGGTLIEGSFLIVNGLNIIHFRRIQKRGIDPLKVEGVVQGESPPTRQRRGKALATQGVFRQLVIFYYAGRGGKQGVGGGVQRRSAGVLQHTDNKADGNHLHRHIV